MKVTVIEERGARMAQLGAAYSLAPMAGSLAGALVTEHLSWRWAFFATVPLALAAWAGVARTPMGEPHGKRYGRRYGWRLPLDWRGAVLLAAMLVCAMLATRGRALGADATALLIAAAVTLLLAWL